VAAKTAGKKSKASSTSKSKTYSAKKTRKSAGKGKAEATPTGKHTPVSNTVTEAEPGRQGLVSLPQTGEAGGVMEARETGAEMLRVEVALEFATAEVTAPEMEGLVDIGAASFVDPRVTLETVHGVDNRIKVEDTDKYPFRVNASLLITARDGSQWIGTAWFISPRTLITAGHCVYIKNSGLPQRDGWVRSIQVMPGRNGSKLPFGSVTSSQFWSVKGWTDSGDENYDYGAIIIPTELGNTVGTMGFAAYDDGELTGATANVTGYPGDKDSGTMWYDTKRIAALSPTKVHYDIDTAGGQSGASLYIVKNGQRIAIAVHAYGGAVTNSGTRISPLVFQNLTNWKA
jgi:glutamyl endopeptidase